MNARKTVRTRASLPPRLLRILQELEALQFGHALGGEFHVRRVWR